MPWCLGVWTGVVTYVSLIANVLNGRVRRLSDLWNEDIVTPWSHIASALPFPKFLNGWPFKSDWVESCVASIWRQNAFICNYLCVTVTVGLLPLLSSFLFPILSLPTSLPLFPSSTEAVLTRSLNNRELPGVLEAGSGPGEVSHPGLQTIAFWPCLLHATRELVLPIVTRLSHDQGLTLVTSWPPLGPSSEDILREAVSPPAHKRWSDVLFQFMTLVPHLSSSAILPIVQKCSCTFSV